MQNNHTVHGSTTSAEKLALLEDKGIVPFLLRIENNGPPKELENFLMSAVLIISVPFGKQKEHFEAYRKLAMAVQNFPIEKVIFISSTSVYSDTNAVVTEDITFEINPAKKILVDLENFYLCASVCDVNVLMMIFFF